MSQVPNYPSLHHRLGFCLNEASLGPTKANEEATQGHIVKRGVVGELMIFNGTSELPNVQTPNPPLTSPKSRDRVAIRTRSRGHESEHSCSTRTAQNEQYSKRRACTTGCCSVMLLSSGLYRISCHKHNPLPHSHATSSHPSPKHHPLSTSERNNQNVNLCTETVPVVYVRLKAAGIHI